jgi:hypothetical protein
LTLVLLFRGGPNIIPKSRSARISDQQEGTPERFGLVAFSSSGSWDLTIDESLDQEDKWTAEIEGPNIYISFSIRDLKVVEEALAYLERRNLDSPGHNLTAPSTGPGELTLGEFGSNSIVLVWDNEEFKRCFLIVGPRANSTMRLSLSGEDVEMLSKAFQEVVNELALDS